MKEKKQIFQTKRHPNDNHNCDGTAEIKEKSDGKNKNGIKLRDTRKH